MGLGDKIKAARMEAGLSQRALCGDRITRNMLSQIENGIAKPSVKTLEYLAKQLGKSVSYFLEEGAVTLPNRQTMEAARVALALGELEKLREALDGFCEPDDVFFEERQLLEYWWCVRRGQQALEEGQKPYGVKLLYRALALDGIYITVQLRYRCRVLLGLAGEDTVLECDEDALLVRAMQCKEPKRRLEILAASENKENPKWILLRAETLFKEKQYEEAAAAYRKLAESRMVLEKLEACFRELGDYKKAYEYACKQREMP